MYGPETLIDIRGELLFEYSVLYLESIALRAVELWGYVFSRHRISSRILDVWGTFGENEWSYGHETLIEDRGDVFIEYSGIYLESIALLGVALWGDVFLGHRIARGIWTFGVCFLGTSGAIATKL